MHDLYGSKTIASSHTPYPASVEPHRPAYINGTETSQTFGIHEEFSIQNENGARMNGANHLHHHHAMLNQNTNMPYIGFQVGNETSHHRVSNQYCNDNVAYSDHTHQELKPPELLAHQLPQRRPFSSKGLPSLGQNHDLNLKASSTCPQTSPYEYSRPMLQDNNSTHMQGDHNAARGNLAFLTKTKEDKSQQNGKNSLSHSANDSSVPPRSELATHRSKSTSSYSRNGTHQTLIYDHPRIIDGPSDNQSGHSSSASFPSFTALNNISGLSFTQTQTHPNSYQKKTDTTNSAREENPTGIIQHNRLSQQHSHRPTSANVNPLEKQVRHPKIINSIKDEARSILPVSLRTSHEFDQSSMHQATYSTASKIGETAVIKSFSNGSKIAAESSEEFSEHLRTLFPRTTGLLSQRSQQSIADENEENNTHNLDQRNVQQNHTNTTR